MNKCDTCKYAEWEWSEIKMIEICADCTLGFRNKFESEDDCGRYSPYCETKMRYRERNEVSR